jgi:hypothetical protein
VSNNIGHSFYAGRRQGASAPEDKAKKIVSSQRDKAVFSQTRLAENGFDCPDERAQSAQTEK